MPGDAAVLPEISNGRMLAWEILQQHEQTDRFLQDLFAESDRHHDLSARDRAAAVDIASGVIRRRRTIDLLIQAQVSKPRHQLEPDLWQLLRVGVYQLLFAKTPPHAAVDTTVELCRALQRERWTRFTNGVLRGVGRLLTEHAAEGPAANALPLHGGQFALLTRDVFPHPADALAAWLADAFSLPNSLAVRWSSRYSPADLLAACFHSVENPRTTLRVNRLKTDAIQVMQQLSAAGCDVVAGSGESSLRISSAGSIERLPGFVEGLWSVQDESAIAAGWLLQPRPGERVLDLCAAPGGKTCHLAELSGDKAAIVACDVSDSRLRRVQANVDRLGLQSVSLLKVDRNGADIPDGPFDAILADVPCSNTGVLNRRPEARWRFQEADLPELVRLQTRLLLQCCERLAPGGRLVYSTCSREPEENQDVVKAVLTAFPDIRLVRELQHLPGQPADGAYQALLVRSDSMANLKQQQVHADQIRTVANEQPAEDVQAVEISREND